MINYKNIRDGRYRKEELSSRFPNISEEKKFYKEVIGEMAVWHTPEEVYEAYQQYHQQGKTVEAILTDIKSSEKRQKEATDRQNEAIRELSNLQKRVKENRKDFNKIYRELGRGIEKADTIVKEALLNIIEEQPTSLIFYNKNNVKITEDYMKRIFQEYFRGTNLENVGYKWREILNPEYLEDIIEVYKITREGAEPIEVFELLVSIGTKLENSINSANETKRKKIQRAIVENNIRTWILSVGVKKLKRDIITDSKRVVINYRVDKGETAPILTEINNRVNRQFRTNFTPIDWLPWIVIGVVALICFGIWFASRRRRIRR
ncbi:hypothetical protein [endosymbiont GvMRE of Glomus versiforme]|uniref:hypothetical protein n=1 Tax=endosymbiont GvMRE of Glomus versiforme TaxID=2039283 RepID=UPI000EF0E861|nr:hypothetical protein [endosymbiont GvMRE of Glomus versiforme]RHZ35207.1 hypothetical protein GvMRE_IIg216 [endosymbiont GvMRE of Glomus versiforme]